MQIHSGDQGPLQGPCVMGELAGKNSTLPQILCRQVPSLGAWLARPPLAPFFACATSISLFPFPSTTSPKQTHDTSPFNELTIFSVLPNEVKRSDQFYTLQHAPADRPIPLPSRIAEARQNMSVAIESLRVGHVNVALQKYSLLTKLNNRLLSSP